jgi:hypothetical protein
VLTPVPVVTGGRQITEEEHFRSLFKCRSGDTRPILVYFHFAHDGAEVTEEGKESAKQCPVLKEEPVERWAVLFRLFEVDADPSDRKVAEKFGLGKGASFALLDAALNVVARSEDLPNARAATEWFRKTLPAKFPDTWKSIEAEIAEQERLAAEARKLVKKDKLAEAIALLDPVRRSDVRIADSWEPTYRELRMLEEKLAREQPPEKAK